MAVNLLQNAFSLGRLLNLTKVRPLAILVLLLVLLVESLNTLPLPWQQKLPAWLLQSKEFLRAPVASSELWLFDSYQQLFPREVLSQPVTIVAIDEKSLAEQGQWPWPRDRLADLISEINVYGPLAIGLDMYMPEPDQGSPDRLAKRLGSSDPDLVEKLELLPSHDIRLAKAISQAPVVLGAAGFDFETFTTSDSMLTAPIQTTGADPLPFVHFYSQVLVSLRMLQESASGQAILSVESTAGPVRKLPLLANVAGKLVPALSLEMLRVAVGGSIKAIVGVNGIERVSVADLTVDTQANSDLWLHYASIQKGLNRYVSAADIMSGDFDPELIDGKLVLLGLTGTGLNDVRYTALNEQVPGVEIQAQVIESMFDGNLLSKPEWMSWIEIALVAVFGGLLIHYVPQKNSKLGYLLKRRPELLLMLLIAISLLILALGFYLFVSHKLLFSASTVIISLSLLMIIFFLRVTLENLSEAQSRMQSLIDHGIALGRQHEQNDLLEKTFDGIMGFSPCDALIVFLKNEDQSLTPVKQTGLKTPWEKHIPLSGGGGNDGLLLKAFYADQPIVIKNTDLKNWSSQDLAFLQTKQSENIYSVLALPMQLSAGDALGLVVMVNAIDPDTSKLINFPSKTIPFIESLVTQTAVAIENSNLLVAQKNMLDAMIKMMAGAIDAKSPYTGGHCERVPELATMLCQAASESSEETLADFAFTTEEQWYEFKIAAWLHDCGKVTTPEHVVDKATKLETIYNRIHEVRMRFEVLLRDAQIAYYESVFEKNVDKSIAIENLEKRRTKLFEDFEFIAECNIGGEFLSPDKQERIMAIAEETWTRHFDNRAGLSDVELMRCPPQVEQLPVQEKLLSDKPEHIIDRPPTAALDAKYGFKLDVPEHLYNLGELHNLTVSRGTLTAEDRFKINEHIIQTIAILEQMPFPPNLKRVPEYAGAHHETLIGTGYPRKLTAEDLSIPARIMAIADIFEALTASDRPYKKSKTLSQSIRILSFFKKDQHIDPVLFDLFLTSGIYLDYAKRFLQPDQIDEVDINEFLG